VSSISHRLNYRDAAVVALVAVVVGAYRLTATSIDLDEAISVEYARVGIASLPRTILGGDPNMRFYFVLLSFWLKLFGEGETAVRSLSLLFAGIAAGTVCLLGAKLFGRAAGALAGSLFAIDPFVVAQAHNARSYTLLTFLVSLASLILFTQRERSSKRARIAYVVVSVLAVYAHFFAALVLLAHAAACLLLWRREFLRREWFLAGAAIVVLCIPVIVSALYAGAGGIAWISAPTPRTIAVVVNALAGGNGILTFGLLACGATALSIAARRRQSTAHLFVAIWLVLPIVAAYAISLRHPVFERHYLIICLPPLLLLAASVVASVGRIAGTAIAAVLMAALAFQLAAFHESDKGRDFRGASNHVLQSARAGDAIVFFPWYARRPYDYYARRATDGFNPALAPPDSMPRRTWLIIRQADAHRLPEKVQQMRDSLSRHARLAARPPFRSVGVELYVR
jgi:mannosyltransferase